MFVGTGSGDISRLKQRLRMRIHTISDSFKGVNFVSVEVRLSGKRFYGVTQDGLRPRARILAGERHRVGAGHVHLSLVDHVHELDAVRVGAALILEPFSQGYRSRAWHGTCIAKRRAPASFLPATDRYKGKPRTTGCIPKPLPSEAAFLSPVACRACLIRIHPPLYFNSAR